MTMTNSENDLICDFIQTKIRQRLTELRQKSELSIEQLAELSGVDADTLNAIESGHDIVTVELMLKLLSYYGGVLEQ